MKYDKIIREEITKINLVKNDKVVATIIDDGNIVTVNGDVGNPWIVSFRANLNRMKELITKYGTNADYFSMYWISGTYYYLSDEIDADKFNEYLDGFNCKDHKNEWNVREAIEKVLKLCDEKDKKNAVQKVSSFRLYDECYVRALEIIESVVLERLLDA